MSSHKSRKSNKSGKVLLPHPQKGAMGKYSTKKSSRSRHATLRKDVEKLGYTSTMRDLNVRATMNKNQAPKASKTMREDMEYLRKNRTRLSNKSRKSRKSRK